MSDMVAAYRPGLKAKLNQDIKLSNGHLFKKGTVSDLIIHKGNGKYHFEAENQACTVEEHEVTFL